MVIRMTIATMIVIISIAWCVTRCPCRELQSIVVVPASEYLSPATAKLKSGPSLPWLAWGVVTRALLNIALRAPKPRPFSPRKGLGLQGVCGRDQGSSGSLEVCWALALLAARTASTKRRPRSHAIDWLRVLHGARGRPVLGNALNLWYSYVISLQALWFSSCLDHAILGNGVDTWMTDYSFRNYIHQNYIKLFQVMMPFSSYLTWNSDISQPGGLLMQHHSRQK